ncbi:putative transmembrane protein [Senna tora]|uniref:Putative transmembrane protein n=1 Tax=Senna tora TaxID=362788 RepID=A0A834T6S6_9FABA|nr:putative transmembrane protein [Senna tora]
MGGFMMRVRLASFFTGAATSSFAGLFILHRDYRIAQESSTQQMKSVYESLDRRISSLEKMKQTQASEPVESSE